MDATEDIRRPLMMAINSGVVLAEEANGQTWDTEQLAAEFDVLGFLAPFVVARNRKTGRKGSLMFRHHPRIYFGWQED